MKLSLVVPAFLAFASIAAPVLAASDIANTTAHKNELVDLLKPVIDAAVSLKDALQKAKETKDLDPTKMETEMPIFNLAGSLTLVVDDIQAGKVKISNFRDALNSLEELSTHTTEVCTRIIDLNSIFVKHNFQEVIALVLGLFAEGFDSLYQGIKQISEKPLPKVVGKSKQLMPFVVHDTVCTLDMTLYVLDPKSTLTDAKFCDKSYMARNNDDWKNLPKTLPGLENCQNHSLKAYHCSLKAQNTWTTPVTQGNWCTSSNC